MSQTDFISNTVSSNTISGENKTKKAYRYLISNCELLANSQYNLLFLAIFKIESYEVWVSKHGYDNNTK